jgi:hypothetical protein
MTAQPKRALPKAPVLANRAYSKSCRQARRENEGYKLGQSKLKSSLIKIKQIISIAYMGNAGEINEKVRLPA